MNYIKYYHDNVRVSVRAIALCTSEELNHELSIITDTILDTLTDHNADPSIYDALSMYMILTDNEDEVDSDTYDSIYSDIYNDVYSRLELLLKRRGFVRAGDYDIMSEDLYNKEVYGGEDNE